MRCFCKSFQGESHIKSGLICQDYSQVLNDLDGQILAVSDGHGDPRHARSDIGSKVACNVTVAAVENVLRKEWFVEAIKVGNFDKLFSNLCARIHSKWTEEVLTHYKNHPLTEREKDVIPPEDLTDYLNGKHISYLYGATLLVACMTRSYYFIIQIGDGLSVIMDKGGAFSVPVEDDPDCIGSKTSSLCGADALKHFRYAYAYNDDTPVAIFLCSDGLEKSYQDNEDIYNIYRSFLHDACQSSNLSDTEAKFIGKLPEISRVGSRDDISLACCYNEALIRNIAPITSYNEEMANMDKERRNLLRLLKGNANEIENSENRIARLEKSRTKKSRELEEIEAKIRQRRANAQRRLEEVQKKKISVQEDLEKNEGIFGRIKNRLEHLVSEDKKLSNELEDAKEQYKAISEEVSSILGENQKVIDSYQEEIKKEKENRGHLERKKNILEKKLEYLNEKLHFSETDSISQKDEVVHSSPDTQSLDENENNTVEHISSQDAEKEHGSESSFNDDSVSLTEDESSTGSDAKKEQDSDATLNAEVNEGEREHGKENC